MDITEDEAGKFAASLARISHLYDDKINPKVVAWVDLLTVGASIYGPRAIAIHARMKLEKPAPNAPARPVPINAPRQSTKAETPARSPVELFGELFSGASIPDAV